MTASRICKASSNLTEPPIALQHSTYMLPVDLMNAQGATSHNVNKRHPDQGSTIRPILGSHLGNLLSNPQKFSKLVYGLIFTPALQILLDIVLETQFFPRALTVCCPHRSRLPAQRRLLGVF